MNIVDKKHYLEYSTFSEYIKDAWFKIDLNKLTDSEFFEAIIFVSNVSTQRWSMYPKYIFFESKSDFDQFKVCVAMGTLEDMKNSRQNGEYNESR